MTFDYEDLYDESRRNEIDVDATIQDLILQREQSLASKDKKEQNHTSLIGGGDSNCDGDSVAPENSEAQKDATDAQENMAATDNSSEVHDIINSLEPGKAGQDNVKDDVTKDGIGAPVIQDSNKNISGKSHNKFEGTATLANINTVTDKLWFFEPDERDMQKIESIKKIREKMSNISSYDELLSQIENYIDNGNTVHEETFFLLTNIYLLGEKFHDNYRAHALDMNHYSGRGTAIEDFLATLS